MGGLEGLIGGFGGFGGCPFGMRNGSNGMNFWKEKLMKFA